MQASDSVSESESNGQNIALSTTLRKEWPEYKLKTDNVFFNGQPTKYQSISLDGKFCNFMTKAYRILPNEQAIEIAEKIAAKCDAKKLSIPSNAAYGWYSEFGDEGHVIANPAQTQIMATYVFEEQNIAGVQGSHDVVKSGFMISNAIDGSRGFSITPMTLRSVCDNYMFHIANERILGVGEGQGQMWKNETTEIKTPALIAANEAIKEAHKEIDLAEATNPTKIKKRHSKKLDEEFITNAILNIKDRQATLMQRYREMFEMKISTGVAQALADSMPSTITKTLESLSVNKKGVATVKGNATEWEVFNEYTENLTYAKKLSYNGIMEHYKTLDKVLVNHVGVVA